MLDDFILLNQQLRSIQPTVRPYQLNNGLYVRVDTKQNFGSWGPTGTTFFVDVVHSFEKQDEEEYARFLRAVQRAFVVTAHLGARSTWMPLTELVVKDILPLGEFQFLWKRDLEKNLDRRTRRIYITVPRDLELLRPFPANDNPDVEYFLDRLAKHCSYIAYAGVDLPILQSDTFERLRDDMKKPYAYKVPVVDTTSSSYIKTFGNPGK